MGITAGKPFKITLKQNGRSRERWQVKLWDDASGVRLDMDSFARLVALMPNGVTPAALSALTDEQLRGVGMSRQKIAYFRDLSGKSLSGIVPLDALDAMTDEEVIAALTQVKGIGRWSAEMFLMFRLHRPDVLPVDDLGIVNAIKNVYRLRKRPTAERIRKIGKAWAPYRSVACWYLWRSLDNE